MLINRFPPTPFIKKTKLSLAVSSRCCCLRQNTICLVRAILMEWRVERVWQVSQSHSSCMCPSCHLLHWKMYRFLEQHSSLQQSGEYHQLFHATSNACLKRESAADGFLSRLGLFHLLCDASRKPPQAKCNRAHANPFTPFFLSPRKVSAPEK